MTKADRARATVGPNLRRRLGLRDELMILLPVATLVLVGLALFTLFSYRGAIEQLAEERRSEAVRLARDLASRLPPSTALGGADLRRLAPLAISAAVLDDHGALLVSFGEIQIGALARGGSPAEPVAYGPDLETGLVVAEAPWRLPAGALGAVRIEVAASGLAGQQRSLRVLTWVVVLVSAALALLLISFLRHLLRPYDALLARARAAGGVTSPDADEAEFLVQTFDRALQALAEAASPTDDIVALGRTLAPSLDSGLLLLDRECQVLALNATGARLLGVTAPPPGTPLERALPSSSPVAGLVLAAARAEEPLQRREVRVQDGDGPARVLGLTLHTLRRDDASVRGHLVLFADLTAAREREDRARLADSLAQLGELAAGVAHELRNSLATLRGYLALIERDPGPEPSAEYMAEIRRETDHLQRVLEDFLAFTRPGSARLERLSLVALAHHAAADPALGAAIDVSVAPSYRGWIHGDEHLLERALRNLLRNAAQAAGSNHASAVELTVAPAGDEVEIRIADRGTGVPATVRERLFHPFVSGRADGVGLGLALTHRIVTLHGGRIELEDRPGGGTIAVLRFPASREASS